MQRSDYLLDELEEMFDIDTNHDGSIDFDELRAWWTQGHPVPA